MGGGGRETTSGSCRSEGHCVASRIIYINCTSCSSSLEVKFPLQAICFVHLYSTHNSQKGILYPPPPPCTVRKTAFTTDCFECGYDRAREDQDPFHSLDSIPDLMYLLSPESCKFGFTFLDEVKLELLMLKSI
jgi:hypothetical protein